MMDRLIESQERSQLGAIGGARMPEFSVPFLLDVYLIAGCIQLAGGTLCHVRRFGGASMVSQPHAVPRPPVTLQALPLRFCSADLMRVIASLRFMMMLLPELCRRK